MPVTNFSTRDRTGMYEYSCPLSNKGVSYGPDNDHRYIAIQLILLRLSFQKRKL